MKNFIKNYWAMSIPLVILIIALLFLFSSNSSNEDQVIGMVEAEFVDVAATFPGKVDSLLVQKGDTVQQGELLAILRTTEINVIKKQALAAIEAAQSNLDLLENGPRTESIKSAQNLYEIAQHQYDLVEKTYQRMLDLYQNQVISGQEKDLIYFKYQAAKKEMEMAQLHLQMLHKGSRPEMIKAAAAILKQAEQAYALTDAIAENTHIKAPVSGIITSLITHAGEIVAMGYPMMSVQKKNSFYVQFNIRQDHINRLQKGTKVTLHIPGCQPEMIDAIVSEIAPALEFANWVPEQGSGQFELRTFNIQCTPVGEVKGLRPGMTAALQLPK